MSRWREYADPQPADSAGDRRDEGRALRRAVPFDAALDFELGPPSSADDLATAIAALPRTGIVVACVGDAPMGVVRDPEMAGRPLDVLDVDNALPGPWEYDVIGLALRLAQGTKPRRRREIARGVGEAYRDAVRSLARRPLYARRPEGLRRALGLGDRRDPGVSCTRAVDLLIRDGRIRRGRVAARWASDANGTTVIRVAPEDPEREMSLYRESLSEPEAMLLSSYRVADAFADEHGRAMVLLGRGGSTRDQLLLEAVPAGPSTLEPAFGVWRLGSDVHRVLAMRSSVPLVPPQLSGWSTSVDGALGRVWQRARAGASGDAVRQAAAGRPGHVGEASRRGALLGVVHACTGDAALLAGYLGNSSRFPEALADAVELVHRGS